MRSCRRAPRCTACWRSEVRGALTTGSWPPSCLAAWQTCALHAGSPTLARCAAWLHGKSCPAPSAGSPTHLRCARSPPPCCRPAVGQHPGAGQLAAGGAPGPAAGHGRRDRPVCRPHRARCARSAAAACGAGGRRQQRCGQGEAHERAGGRQRGAGMYLIAGAGFGPHGACQPGTHALCLVPHLPPTLNPPPHPTRTELPAGPAADRDPQQRGATLCLQGGPPPRRRRRQLTAAECWPARPALCRPPAAQLASGPAAPAAGMLLALCRRCWRCQRRRPRHGTILVRSPPSHLLALPSLAPAPPTPGRPAARLRARPDPHLSTCT